ncbi:phage tail spike protein [Paraclostridium bifermentans]
MLHLHDINKKKIAGLVNYKDLYIESELQSGDKTLCFSYPKNDNYHSDIIEECYIRTKENEYVVKEKNIGSEYTSFKCILNLESLEGHPFERYASEEQTIDKAIALALAGTGWIVGKCSLKKKRTVRLSNCSSLEVIKEIKKIYRCDLVFNTLSKTIDVYEHLGEDKGTYFIDSLNLKDLSIQGNSYDFFTRIIPIGKDNLRITSINDGKDYVENYQYSKKIKTFYWIDERYTVVENLKEDAEAKLAEISKPYRSYSADIINLAKLNDEYKNILDFKLGDTITLISKENKFRDKHRIVKIIEHPDEPELDSIEIANTTLSFEETQTQFQEAADTVNNITTDNGTIDGSTVDNIETKQISDFEANVIKVTNLTAINAKINHLEAVNVNITGTLTAVQGTIGTLTSNLATIDKLTVTHSALINDLQVNKADITQLNATNATIKVLEANVGKIETLVNGNLSSENIQAGGITSDKLTIANGFIKNAMIEGLDVSKVNAGDISTSKFRIKSDDGGVEIVGATQQFKDDNGVVRIQMGKDTQGNFNFILRGEDGVTTLIDHTGIKENAITDKLIKTNMLDDKAVTGNKLDYNSFTEEFNKESNSNTIKASKVQLDGTNQSLEISFNEMITKSETIENEISDINKNKMYRVEIISSNGNIFKNGSICTILKAVLYSWDKNITDTVDASKFRWYRVSDDLEADSIWNQSHFGGKKEVKITTEDVKGRATFYVDVLDENGRSLLN